MHRTVSLLFLLIWNEVFAQTCPPVTPQSTNTFNMITKQPQLSTWIEGGFTAADERTWVTLTTTLTTFVNAVVFVSLPEIPGETSAEGYPAIARVRNVVTSGQVSFQTKIYLANDTFCLKTWYTPQPINPKLKLAWMVVEQGAYNVTGSYFFIGSGPITRENSDVTNQNNFVRFNYPVGCISTTESCAFEENTDIGIITQLQTVVYDRLLIPRGVSIQRRFSRIVLQPHDSVDTSYYVMTSPETLGYIAFRNGVKISCIEKLTIETQKYYPVTHIKVGITYHYSYNLPPGVFGMVGSSASLADSTGLRAFDRTTTSASIITQEDQCYDEETVHTTPEVVFVMIIGEQTSVGTCTVCRAFFVPDTTEAPTSAPTVTPTRAPTASPTRIPTAMPTSSPTRVPTASPTFMPTMSPTHVPTAIPTQAPTLIPTSIPTVSPTRSPTFSPTATPTRVPTAQPTFSPTFVPTVSPTSHPTNVPTPSPTALPTSAPTSSPTSSPTAAPTSTPTASPTALPTASPTATPTSTPTASPTSVPTSFPTVKPTSHPTFSPTAAPTSNPTSTPTSLPSSIPSAIPSGIPTGVPTSLPTSVPTGKPSASPTSIPTVQPTARPTTAPTHSPTASPTPSPTSMPTSSPTVKPTFSPTAIPTSSPTTMPTAKPTSTPTASPTAMPTASPTAKPTSVPTSSPTSKPTSSPTSKPTIAPTISPTSSIPTSAPSFCPEFDESQTDVVDLVKKTPVHNIWIEGGFTALNNKVWTKITTTHKSFSNAVVFVGLPEIPGETSAEGYPAIARVRNVINSNGVISFEARIYIADDDFCLKTWYTPRDINPPIAVSWLVVEQGVYSVHDAHFMIGKGPITRQNADVTNQNNFVRFNYPVGCISNTESCAFRDETKSGIILQLQTLVYDRLLIPRGVVLQKRFARIVLQPHDSVDPNYYIMTTPETLAYMAFDTGVSMSCVEKLTFELHKFTGVTHIKLNIAFDYDYLLPPGLFGSIGSSVSLADSTGLRAFGRTDQSVNIITQEDQCYDEETVHTTPEVVYAMIVGEQNLRSSCVICKAIFNPSQPVPSTSAPTVKPTTAPSRSPTTKPTTAPVAVTGTPTHKPTMLPTVRPTMSPTRIPTSAPITRAPTPIPTFSPTANPTRLPTRTPTRTPSTTPIQPPSVIKADTPTVPAQKSHLRKKKHHFVQ